jgi:phosphoglycolate phosphatase
MKKYSCIIFDWDGTLMDSAQKISECIRAAAIDVGLPVPTEEEARDIIGLGLAESMQVLFGDIGDEKINHTVERYKHYFLHQNKTAQPLFSGISDGLESLSQAGAFLSVATGKARAGLNRVLAAESMHDFFIYTRCADESRTKPHPQMLLDTFEFLAMEPENCLMVGDTEYDMQMAVNAGVDALGVSYGVHTEKRLRDAGAIHVVDNVPFMMDWLHERIQPAFGEHDDF